MQPIADAINMGNQQILGSMAQLVDKIDQAQSRPKTVVRGPDGKIVGVQ